MVLPVMPFDHSTVAEQLVAVSTTLDPLQTEVPELVITGTEALPTVTVTGSENTLIHVCPVQNALNDCVVATFIVIELPVCPLFQVTVPLQPVAVNVTLPG
jgi:hypothetical protein